mmetsp:Transcript_101999/g.263657  ORF Transcript_101999/g.263657 Transcript_101999/m.263657 type:complete len:346 (+) Transcript_101999:121-1158(+)
MGLPRHTALLSLAWTFFCISDASAVKRTVKANPVKFLIVSAPKQGKVSYMRIQHVSLRGDGRNGDAGEVEDLITSGLTHPQGLAVDELRQQLLIADPGQKKILSFPMIVGDGTIRVGPYTVLASGPEARWVSIDAIGNVFFSDEPKNQILKISRSQVLKGNSTPEVVYDGASLAQVSAPGGIAIDSFHAYWVNKQVGSQVGSVVRAGETPDATSLESSVLPLARNTDKSYGVCLALNNVFFTQPETTLFGVKKTGGSVVPVSQRFTNPRGCVWDGDGTVYVADRGSNAVFSLAANMQELGEAQITRVADVEDAFGVAVFSGASRHAAALMIGIALLAQVVGAQLW